MTFLNVLSENVGLIDGQSTTSTYGDYAQLGGSRNTFESPVDQSSNKTAIGHNAQIGGTSNIRE